MDIPDYAYERMAKCLLPIMRAYFESEDGKTTLLNLEEDGENRHAAQHKKRCCISLSQCGWLLTNAKIRCILFTTK